MCYQGKTENDQLQLLPAGPSLACSLSSQESQPTGRQVELLNTFSFNSTFPLFFQDSVIEEILRSEEQGSNSDN